MMKLCFLLLTVALATLLATPANAQASKFSGRVPVPGLGTITFPAGEWLLEFHGVEAAGDNPRFREYFVFRNTVSATERLTFVRYASGLPKPLAHLLDSTTENLGDGMPPGGKPGTPTKWTNHPMRLEPANPTLEERTIRYSFVHMPDKPPFWLCHAVLIKQNDTPFVIVHASTLVTSPEVVQEVLSGAIFEKERPHK